MRVTRSDLSALAGAAFEVLERTAVRVVEAAAADALAAAGAGRDGDIVRIPRRVVEQALNSAPRRFRLYDAAGQPAIVLDRCHVHFGTGSDTPNVRDLETGQRRPALLEDVARAARLCDGLGEIDFVMSMGLAGGQTLGQRLTDEAKRILAAKQRQQ